MILTDLKQGIFTRIKCQELWKTGSTGAEGAAAPPGGEMVKLQRFVLQQGMSDDDDDDGLSEMVDYHWPH